MPSDSLTFEKAASASPAHLAVLEFLRGKDNPFDQFVAARKADVQFARFHVPNIHKEIHDPLTAVLERYRLERLEWESDLPRSGVLVVQGKRGIGKTHMVHALQRGGEEEAPRVVVTPQIYEPHRPFIEYLLHQLVRHFQNEAEVVAPHPGTLDLLADSLARHILAQAIHSMSEIDWLGRNLDGKWSFLQFFLGHTKGIADQKALLIRDLQDRDCRSIMEICKKHEQETNILRSLAGEQIGRLETGLTLGCQIRRGLYTRLVERAFGEPSEILYDFLLDGFTQVESKTQPSRETLVDELFQSLLELCLLARMPVVFAFDALESLVGDPPDPKICHPFFKGLADVLDSHRGIPFLLFAESGHWEQARKIMSDYVIQRFQQGVLRVPRYGSLSVLQFPPISARQLGDLVVQRMKPIFAECQDWVEEEVPRTFPFAEEDLAKIAREPGNEPPLRLALQALRDRYDELVNGKASFFQTPTKPMVKKPPIEALETCWQREQREAKRRLESGAPSACADDLQDGIKKWFESLQADGAATPTGLLTAVENIAPGNLHPTYGQITRFHLDQGGARRAVGLGLLLGAGTGMPRDLETKLKLMSGAACPVATLTLLWPRGADLEPPIHEHFPAGTRTIWDSHPRANKKIDLKAIDLVELATWLALPTWLNVVRSELEEVPADVIHHFVAERTSDLLALITPRS